jgi:hypothetical protein
MAADIAVECGRPGDVLTDRLSSESPIGLLPHLYSGWPITRGAVTKRLPCLQSVTLVRRSDTHHRISANGRPDSDWLSFKLWQGLRQ